MSRVIGGSLSVTPLPFSIYSDTQLFEAQVFDMLERRRWEECDMHGVNRERLALSRKVQKNETRGERSLAAPQDSRIRQLHSFCPAEGGGRKGEGGHSQVSAMGGAVVGQLEGDYAADLHMMAMIVIHIR